MLQKIHIGLLYTVGLKYMIQLLSLLVTIDCVDKTDSFFTRTRLTSYWMQQCQRQLNIHC